MLFTKIFRTEVSSCRELEGEGEGGGGVLGFFVNKDPERWILVNKLKHSVHT